MVVTYIHNSAVYRFCYASGSRLFDQFHPQPRRTPFFKISPKQQAHHFELEAGI